MKVVSSFTFDVVFRWGGSKENNRMDRWAATNCSGASSSVDGRMAIALYGVELPDLQVLTTSPVRTSQQNIKPSASVDHRLCLCEGDFEVVRARTGVMFFPRDSTRTTLPCE